jgi:hypothetical protein
VLANEVRSKKDDSLSGMAILRAMSEASATKNGNDMFDGEAGEHTTMTSPFDMIFPMPFVI